MPRFFADKITDGDAYFIEDAPHITKTLRMQPGDGVTAMDGRGGVFLCSISHVDKHRVIAKVISKLPAQSEPGVKVTVYQGMCRAHRFEYVVQKCTELGAQAIVPLLLHRCETREYSPAKLERFHKIAREAAKQSGRSLIPEIRWAIEPGEIPEHDLLLCPYEQEQDTRLKQLIAGKHPDNVGIVIGPEGGFEPNEIDALADNGGRVFTLGSRILRTETASPAVLAMLMYELGEV